jgi:hypothetical protein
MTVTQAQFDTAWAMGSIDFAFAKASVGSSGPAGCNNSYWTAAGEPATGTVPTAAVVPTRTTTGAIYFVPPASGNTYICFAECLGQFTAEPIIIADRVMNSGSLSGTNTGVQTINTPALPADRGIRADYGDVSWWLEFYTATGANATTATITYTNQGGTPGRTCTVGIAAASGGIQKMILISPAAGDTIKSIESLQLSGTTGTVGNFGVTAIRELCHFKSQLLTNVPVATGWSALGLPRVYDNACLQFIARFDGYAAGNIAGRIILGQW